MNHRAYGCAVVALVVGACTDTDSATDLNPEGPPMIRQVRMVESVPDTTDPNITRNRTVFAFGTHPLAMPDEISTNLQTAAAQKNAMRIIIDELLVGNNLEQIACRDNTYARVPIGATPDDIARCSVPNDALLSSCSKNNKHSVCLCANPAGCVRPKDPVGTETVPEGDPVGVLDLNMDGATDNTQFIAGAVGIQCGTIGVPINLDMSYWNPSGDQNKPAMGGFDVLGPAIVLVPNGALPTSATCNLTFADDVVDKQGVRVCAPASGEIAAGCTPGDVSAFQFKVEPLLIRPSTFKDGDTGVAKAGPIVFEANAPLDTNSLANLTIAPNPPGAVMVTQPMPGIVRIDVTGGFAPNTMYTVTFPVTITDSYHQPLPLPRVLHFTTGA